MPEQQFTIRTFIDNRWADALEEVARVDPDFVKTVESYGNTQKMGLILPDGVELPTPSRRLSHRWHNLLAATYDVVHELDNLQLNVSLLDPQSFPPIDRRLAIYHFEVWVQHVFNLCDKVRTRFVTLSCRQYLRAQGNVNWREREKHYQDEVRKTIQDEIEQFRSGLVHGEGGKGVLADRVITDKHEGWEVCVIGGPGMIEKILEASYQVAHSPGAFFRSLSEKTEYVTMTLGAILEELEQEIVEAKHPSE